MEGTVSARGDVMDENSIESQGFVVRRAAQGAIELSARHFFSCAYAWNARHIPG